MSNNAEDKQPDKTPKSIESNSLAIGKVVGFAVGYLLISRLLVNWAAKKVTDEDVTYSWDLLGFMKNSNN